MGPEARGSCLTEQSYFVRALLQGPEKYKIGPRQISGPFIEFICFILGNSAHRVLSPLHDIPRLRPSLLNIPQRG
jgi:hypothetical protein